jgi:hypothetical protein
MQVSNNDILKAILLNELDRMEPETSTFEDDPMKFILSKYQGLKTTLEYLMTPSFEEYVTGIYVVAPKPTTFKVVLHNGQFFFLQFMGRAYEATVLGKKYYLMTIGEKERAMVAISRLLRFGNPLKTKGPDGAEQATRDSEGPAEEAGPTPPAEGGAGEGEEQLAESKILESILKEELVNEAETGEAVLFESALVYAWYQARGETPPEDAISPEELKKLKSNPKIVKAASNTINALKLTGGKKAMSTGRSGASVSLTPFWSGQGATNTTPKTDVILGNKKISVKVGNSQLMSGGKNESLATFYAAAKKVPGILKTKEAQDVIKTFDKFVEGGYTKSGGVADNLKSGKDQIIKAGDEAHKEMATKLENLFNKSEAFKIAFAQEAMSGYEKFGPDSIASADWVLSTDKNYGNPKIKSTQDDSYATKIADQMKLTVRFKSTSEKLKGEKTGRYRFWSVVSLISDPTKLKEGITDTIKSYVNKAKEFITNGVYSLTKFIVGDSLEDGDIKINNTIDFN